MRFLSAVQPPISGTNTATTHSLSARLASPLESISSKLFKGSVDFVSVVSALLLAASLSAFDPPVGSVMSNTKRHSGAILHAGLCNFAQKSRSVCS